MEGEGEGEVGVGGVPRLAGGEEGRRGRLVELGVGGVRGRNRAGEGEGGEGEEEVSF